jgi:SagB-type dehydrogenase family enzyme
MRLRASQTAIVIPEATRIIFFDYLSKRAIEVSTEVIHWFQAFAGGRTINEVISDHPEYEPQSVRSTIESMFDCGLLVDETSQSAATQQSLCESWSWGPLAASFHFATQNLDFISLEESQSASAHKAASQPSPALDWHERYSANPTRTLPPPNQHGIFDILHRRRTNRNANPVPLGKNQLADCLYAGLAITGFVKTPSGNLPLTPTPSGGARNPYEAFVFVQNVEGLSPGFYHYSALHHQLRSVNETIPNNPADLLAGQDWANKMPAIIFLVAVLERTMWKYEEASAYKVVLIESGHIAQNIMLAATAHGLSACPTAALAHQLIANHLGLEELTHTPIYALALCDPGAYDSDLIPNPHILHAAVPL